MNLIVYLFITLSITFSSFNQGYSNAAKPWKSKCSVLNIPNAKIRIRARGRTAKIRCESDFTMIEGDRRLTCIKGKWNGRIPQCISSGCSIDSVPNGGAIELYDGALLHFHCNPGYTLTGSPALFCDGLNWNSSYPQCEVPPPNPDHLSCTFETSDLCGWVQDHIDDLDWKWTTGTNNAFAGSLGAKTDHTLLTPSGHYILADSKDDWFHGSVARLFSPIILTPVQTPSCVIFWYHMNGYTTGSLNVYTKPESEPFEMSSPSFRITGYNQDAWKLAYIGLPDIDEEFLQIIFEAKRGDDFQIDIAIDDFLVTSGEECIKSEIKLLEQQSNYSSQTSLFYTNRPIPTRPPVKSTTKSKAKSTTSITTETEEFDYSYFPFSTSPMKVPHESTTMSTFIDNTSAALLESTTKATTPRKIYISTHRPTLPIILVPTPTNIILTPFLPRKTLTPIAITTAQISHVPDPDEATKDLATTISHETTVIKETLHTKDNTSHSPTNNSLYLSSTKLFKKLTTVVPIKSTSISSLRPTTISPSRKSLLYFSSVKPVVELTTTFPKTLPPKYSSLSTGNVPLMTQPKTSLKPIINTKLKTSPTTSTKIKLSTKSTNEQKLYSKHPSNYTASVISNSHSSSNRLHTRTLPGVVILISMAGIGLLVTGVLLGLIWIKRQRQRPFLADDSDERRLKEEMTEDDHNTGGNEDHRNRRTFPTSYRPLESSHFPQEYDGTPV